MTKKVTYQRFIPEEEYIKSFENRKRNVPPFIVFQPYEIRDSVPGYMVPCEPGHPDAEPVDKSED